MGYNLHIYVVNWGHNPFTNHLLSSWNIQVGVCFGYAPFGISWKILEETNFPTLRVIYDLSIDNRQMGLILYIKNLNTYRTPPKK